MKRSLRPVLVGLVGAAVLVTGCGSPSSGASASSAKSGSSGTSTSSAKGAPSSGKAAATSESSPLGDIPDNIAYVPYPAADGSFTVTVPEGWSRTDLTGGASFTDKLNTVTVQEVRGRPQPTPDSVRAGELKDISAHGGNVVVGTVESRTLPAGPAVHASYSAQSASDPVTGRTVTDDVELYVFWRNGTEVLLTLSGPHGADDVDAWRRVSTSFRWQ